MTNFDYPYNDLVICKDSTDYLSRYQSLSNLTLAAELLYVRRCLCEYINVMIEYSVQTTQHLLI